MSDDATTPPFPPEMIAGTQTATETTTKTIENEAPGGPKGRRPGELLGMSGRFWISMVALLGLVVLSFRFGNMVVGILEAGGKLESAELTFMITIYTSYSSAATVILGAYLGQNSGPTKPKPS